MAESKYWDAFIDWLVYRWAFVELSIKVGRIVCFFYEHNWHELYNPDGRFYHNYMCERCIKFAREKPKEIDD